MSLNFYLPDYFVREIHHLAVRTAPSDTYDAICQFDMARIPWIAGLFRLRTALDENKPERFTLTLHDAYRNGGFIRLNEIEGEELTVGAIGKIWRPAIPFEKVTPEEYAHFHSSGYAKVAWSLRCARRIGGGTLCSLEVRVGATDSISAAKMRSYYSLIGPFSRAIRRSVFKRFSRELGDIFADEASRELAGDSLITAPVANLTQSITIEASPEAIWPWLVQMGCLRGGWYSYDWLDNAGVRSASAVIPEWQNINEGDAFPATPGRDGYFYVVSVKPLHHLILGGCFDLDSNQAFDVRIDPLPSNYFRTAWAFVLEPQTSNVTRLITRARADYQATKMVAPYMRSLLTRPVHFLMQRKQLINLRQRAENLYAQREAVAAL
jgi:hypothetical protein